MGHGIVTDRRSFGAFLALMAIAAVGLAQVSGGPKFHPPGPPFYGEISFSSPVATNTTSGTPVKAAGTTTLGANFEFDMPANNRLRYTGSLRRLFHCEAYVSMEAGSNTILVSIFFAEGGAVAADTEVQRFVSVLSTIGAASTAGIFELGPNEYVELFVDTNAGDPTVTINVGNLICTGV